MMDEEPDARFQSHRLSAIEPRETPQRAAAQLWR
jgi:hypothetical protein